MSRASLSHFSRLRNLIPTGGSLSHRFARASALTVLETLGNHSIRLASNLILARLLVPDMFGLMVFAGTIYSAIELLTDLGVPLSIQREPGGEEPRFLRAAWTVSVLRGLVVGICILVGAIGFSVVAPSLFRADSVYAQPEAPVLLGLIAFVPVLTGLISSNLYLALREMRLGRVIVINMSSQLASMLWMTGFALIWPSVWALVSGMLLSTALKAIASHTVLPGVRMRWTWDREVFGRLWKFGKWLMISTPLGFLSSSMDTLVLGALFNTSTFGVYSISRLWALAWGSLSGQFIRVVGLPGLSDVARNRPGDLARATRKMLRVVDASSLTSCLALTFCAQLLIEFFYLDAYQGAARFLHILALLLLNQHFRTLQTALLSLGHSKVSIYFALQNAIATGLGIGLCYRFWGAEAAVYAAVFGQFASVPSLLYFCSRLLPSYRAQQDLVWIAVVAAAVTTNILLLPEA